MLQSRTNPALVGKYDVTPVNFMMAERRLLELSGLPMSCFEVKLVNVCKDFDGVPVYIRTILCDVREGKPVLVKVHGHGSGAAMFFKCIKGITEHFSLILIDLPGMGGSTRVEDYYYEQITAEQSIEYFVNYLEQWRQCMDNLKDFYLLGHSLGAYISAHYAIRYPNNIKKLLLASPVGVCPALTPGERKSWSQFVKSKADPPIFFETFFKYAWRHRITEFDVYRFLGLRLSHFAMSKGMEQEYHYLNQVDRSAILDYKFQIYMQRGFTEKCIQVMFDVGVDKLIEAKIPLSSKEVLGNPSF